MIRNRYGRNSYWDYVRCKNTASRVEIFRYRAGITPMIVWPMFYGHHCFSNV